MFNPRVAIGEFNEEAARFAGEDRIPAGAGSDAHVPQGLGSVRIRMRDFDGPEEFSGVAARGRHHPQPREPSLRAGAQVLRRRRCLPRPDVRHEIVARGGSPSALRRATPDARARTSFTAVQSEEDACDGRRDPREYLERAIRELNAFARDLQGCPRCPRGQLMPVLGSGHPQADIFLLKYAPKPAEVEEVVAFYGRTGNAPMKSLKRLQIDPLAVYGTLCVKCPVPDPTLADPGCVARLLEELAIVQPKIVVVMGCDALAVLNDLEVPLAHSSSTSRRIQSSRPRSMPYTCRTSMRRLTKSRPSGLSGLLSGCSGTVVGATARLMGEPHAARPTYLDCLQWTSKRRRSRSRAIAARYAAPS